MSPCHTRGSIVGARKRPYFLTFSFIFARFGRFVSLFRVLVHAFLYSGRIQNMDRGPWTTPNFQREIDRPC